MVILALNADAKDGMWNMLGDHGSAPLLHCAGLILYISLSSITPRLWFALLCKAYLSPCECSPAASWWRCFILLCSYKPSECVWGDVGLWLHVFLLTSLFEWWHTVSLVSKAHFNPSLTLTLNLLNSLLTSAESNKVCASFTLNHREVKKTPPEAGSPSTPSDSNCDLLADGQTDWVYICTDVKMFAGFLPVRCSQSFSVFERPLL